MLGVLMQRTITKVDIYVNITHTYQGDLQVSLTSPERTTVMLHNRTGGSDANVSGWYPDELEPAESLDAFIGEETDGFWILKVSDHAGADTGTLNEWCVRLAYGEIPSDVETSDLPRVLSLRANHPNPFNPRTAIRFDLPRLTEVDLAVFDVAGCRVAILASGSMEPGRYDVAWEGRDDSGLPVSGGLYFYRLTTEGRTLTKKMVFLK